MMHRVEKTFAGRKLVIETGRMAKQASGSAVVTSQGMAAWAKVRG